MLSHLPPFIARQRLLSCFPPQTNRKQQRCNVKSSIARRQNSISFAMQNSMQSMIKEMLQYALTFAAGDIRGEQHSRYSWQPALPPPS